ncbi:MAG: dethiobiotin synthase [Methylophilaceae bacterium]|nr:dethiobiotin synthase [Methylophilaceae bacterium]
MKQGFFITGTDTGVGKTLIATALVHGFAQSGKRVIGMKPVAAGAALQDGQVLNDDVVQLIAASNVEAPLSLINPYVFEPPVAPHIAAAQAGISMRIPKLKSDFESLNDAADVVVVEGAGGFLVPLNDSEDMADLAVALGLPIILVVGMRLGCLNHALLTVAAIAARDLRLAGWIANRIDPQMTNFSENLESLRQRITAPCLGVVPYSSSMDFRQVSAYLELPT